MLSDRIKAIGFVALCIMLSASAATKKPHVLFIAIDDMRPDIGCYGNAEVHSPQIDKIAAEGIVFHRAYCQQALCGPSRVSVMTGVHPDQLKIWGMSKSNKYEWRTKCPGVTSLTEQFRKNGYKAIGFGKIYDNRLGLDKKHSWDSFNSGWKGMYANPKDRKNSQKKGVRPAVECMDVKDNVYTDGSNTNLAIKVLKAHNPKQPLFLAVGFTKPHLPFVAPKKYWDLYDRSKLTLTSRRTPPTGHTRFLLSKYKEIFDFNVPNPVPKNVERELLHGYYACVSYVDAQFGKIVKALKDKGIYDDTIIVIWGDHGFKLGDYGEWAKHTNLELDARVPLIMKLPKGCHTAGHSTKALVELVDVLPTMCEAAGIPIPKSADGISLMPVIRGPNASVRKLAMTQYPRQEGTMAYSIRTAHWRYHEVRKKKGGAIVARELYDLSNGFIETENLAAERPEVVSNHAILLDAYLKKLKANAGRPARHTMSNQ